MARQYTKFWKAVHLSLITYPAAFPVHVRTLVRQIKVRIPQDDGTKRTEYWDSDCTLFGSGSKRHFMIRIARFDEEIMIENWIHEYPHALNWSLLHDTAEAPVYHDDGWGIWFARCYRLIRGDH